MAITSSTHDMCHHLVGLHYVNKAHVFFVVFFFFCLFLLFYFFFFFFFFVVFFFVCLFFVCFSFVFGFVLFCLSKLRRCGSKRFILKT